MSSQKQWHRAHSEYMGLVNQYKRRAEQYRDLCAWYESRPPWWKFWAVRKWKGEEPT